MGQGSPRYTEQEISVCPSQLFPEGPKQYTKTFQSRNGLKINTKAARRKKT